MPESPSAEELLANLQAANSGQSPDTPTAPVPPPVAEPVPEQAPAETPPADPESPETPPEPAVEPAEEPENILPTKPKQIRLAGQDFHFAALRKSGLSVEQAIAQAYGVSPPAAQTAPVPPAEVAPAEDPITRLEAEREAVKQRLKEAGESESYVTPDFIAAVERRTEIELELREAKAAKAAAEAEAKAQQQQAAETEFDAEWNADFDELIGLYGDTAKDGGGLQKAILEEFDKAHANPAHRFHRDASNGTLSPLTVGTYIAAKLGTPPAKAATTPAAAPTSTATASTRIPPVSGSARTAPPPPAGSQMTAIKQKFAAARSAEEMIAALQEADGSSNVPMFRVA